MKQEAIIKGFAQLGKLMRALGSDEQWSDFSVGVTEAEYHALQVTINKQFSLNGWFVKENVRKSLLALGNELTEENLTQWAKNYSFHENPKKVAVIMAGNIPLVGFHDFLSVLISGHHVVAKLSSDDATLLPKLAEHLVEFTPELQPRIRFSQGRIGEVEAVIATGSNNSLKYFEQYFGKYPHIFRKNRTSMAVLDGNETKEQLSALGDDIFQYFGLGCRNVSHLMIPKDFELNRFFEAIVHHGEVINNNKYGNNYDYNKAVYLMNKAQLLDNNFLLLRESKDLFSPLSMIHYQRYSDQEEVDVYLAQHQEDLQVIVGNKYTPFGKAQAPALDDYADGVDTMQWLSEL
ncbi:MAG: acyl-CoA reductase [bacterium]|nr:acyl-CoA reductase [bacterium]